MPPHGNQGFPQSLPCFLPVCCMWTPLPPPHIAEPQHLWGEDLPLWVPFHLALSLYQAQDFCFRKQAPLSAQEKFISPLTWIFLAALSHHSVPRELWGSRPTFPSPMHLGSPWYVPNI